MLALWSIPLPLRIVLTIFVIIALIYILIRFRADRNLTSDSLQILEERMENGEISFKDYLQAKRSRGK